MLGHAHQSRRELYNYADDNPMNDVTRKGEQEGYRADWLISTSR